MIGFCVVFSFGVAYIAYRGVTGTTGVNIAINIIQITALLIFSVIAIGYRISHHRRVGGLYARSRRQSGAYQVDQVDVADDKGKPVQTLADNSPRTTKDSRSQDQDRAVTKKTGQGQSTADGIGEGDPYPVLKKDARASWSQGRHAVPSRCAEHKPTMRFPASRATTRTHTSSSHHRPSRWSPRTRSTSCSSRPASRS